MVLRGIYLVLVATLFGFHVEEESRPDGQLKIAEPAQTAQIAVPGCWELYIAYIMGFLTSDKLSITGPNAFAFAKLLTPATPETSGRAWKRSNQRREQGSTSTS